MSSRPESLLRSTFLDSLPGPECEHILALTQELSAPLTAWCARYPSLLRRDRVPQASLTLAASAPFLGLRELLPTGYLFLWLSTVDSLFDERLHAEEAAPLWARFEQAVALFEAPEGAPPSEEPLHQAMRDVQGALAPLPLFAALRTPLADALRDFPERPAPSLQEYLEKAACFTTGTLPIYLGVLMATRDETILQRLPHFMGLGHEAALSIRLADDLHNYEKKLAEGKLNALLLLQRAAIAQHGTAPAAALEQSRAEVSTHLQGALERCNQLGGDAASAGYWATQAIVNVLAFACEFDAPPGFHPGEARPSHAPVTPPAST
jgi:hypothetical protein